MADPETFIRAWTRPEPVPLVPELRLFTASEVTPLWQATEDVLARHGLPPPFWAFPWAGGQAVARWLLDAPDRVRGRTVLDFGAGCGLAALAARRAGAARAVATDVDPLAAVAQHLNAQVNGLALDHVVADIIGTPPGCGPLAGIDTVLACDVCYEAPLADRALPWLRRLAGAGLTVILGDPGRAYLPAEGLRACARYPVPTPMELEDRTTRLTTVWMLEG